MIFESLYESAQKGELLLIQSGYCRYHLRKDGQLTIYEIITTLEGLGVGYEMLQILKQVEGAEYLVAKCPVDLEANNWYMRQGFVLEKREITSSGRELNVWLKFLE